MSTTTFDGNMQSKPFKFLEMLNMNDIISLADYRTARTKNDDDAAKSLELDIKNMLSSMTLSIEAIIELREDNCFDDYEKLMKALWFESNDLIRHVDMLVDYIQD